MKNLNIHTTTSNDLIVSKEGKEFLEKINLPINLLRISVGVENIDEIINEFEKVNAV